MDDFVSYRIIIYPYPKWCLKVKYSLIQVCNKHWDKYIRLMNLIKRIPRSINYQLFVTDTQLFFILGYLTVLLWAERYKGLESDPFKSPPAQQHFATVLDFHLIKKPFLLKWLSHNVNRSFRSKYFFRMPIIPF